jgi:hypothetical protein
LTVSFEFLNDKHLVSASKDRTGLFTGITIEFIINSTTGKKTINLVIKVYRLIKLLKKSMPVHLMPLKQVYGNIQIWAPNYPVVMAEKKCLIIFSAQLIHDEEIIQNLNPQEKMNLVLNNQNIKLLMKQK